MTLTATVRVIPPATAVTVMVRLVWSPAVPSVAVATPLALDVDWVIVGPPELVVNDRHAGREHARGVLDRRGDRRRVRSIRGDRPGAGRQGRRADGDRRLRGDDRNRDRATDATGRGGDGDGAQRRVTGGDQRGGGGAVGGRGGRRRRDTTEFQANGPARSRAGGSTRHGRSRDRRDLPPSLRIDTLLLVTVTDATAGVTVPPGDALTERVVSEPPSATAGREQAGGPDQQEKSCTSYSP